MSKDDDDDNYYFTQKLVLVNTQETIVKSPF